MALEIKAIVFSMGEPTTQLCVEALYRNGLDVEVWADRASFVDKMDRLCSLDREVLRVDADVIVNDDYIDYVQYSLENRDKIVWSKPHGLIWWDQRSAPISAGYMHPKSLKTIKKNIGKARYNQRPERFLWNLNEFRDSSTLAQTTNHFVGIKGYGIRDIEKVRQRKESRNQSYDWEWIESINRL